MFFELRLLTKCCKQCNTVSSFAFAAEYDKTFPSSAWNGFQSFLKQENIISFGQKLAEGLSGHEQNEGNYRIQSKIFISTEGNLDTYATIQTPANFILNPAISYVVRYLDSVPLMFALSENDVTAYVSCQPLSVAMESIFIIYFCPSYKYFYLNPFDMSVVNIPEHFSWLLAYGISASVIQPEKTCSVTPSAYN